MTPTTTETLRPSETATMTLTPTITVTQPPPEGVVAVERAHCRYGPGAAYLHEYGFLEGLPVEVLGQNQRGRWLYVLGLYFETGCWIREDLIEITAGDVASVPEYYGILPYNDLYPPPAITGLTRIGDEVTIAWADVGMTEDDYRGYLIEAWVCVDGEIVFTPINIDGTLAVIRDEAGCEEESQARIYSAEKHGYSNWRIIGWPPHEGKATATPY